MQRKPPSKREIQSNKSKAPLVKQASKTSQDDSKSKWNIPILLVMGLTLLAYAQVFGFFYLNWDDNLNITENPNVTNFTLQKIGDIFSLDHGTIIGNYNPLPILSFGLEKMMIGGLNPIVAHGINLAFHIACVYLVYRLFLLLKFENFGALFIALLFGIHPMRVESVAWVTERKDVLFAFFFLLSLIQYLRLIQNEKSTKNYVLMLVFAVLAMLSKVQAVSLPLAMLMIDYWMKRPNPLKLILEKWPLWLMSLGTGLLTIYTLRTYGSLDTAFQDQSILLKLGIATTSFVTYLYKFIVPFPMIPLYPFPSELSTFAYFSIAIVAAIIGLCVAFRKNEAARIWIFGLGFFTVNVIFVLQFVNAGQGYMADRFTYMSYIGLFAILAWYLQKWQKLASRKNLAQVVTYGFAGICLLLTYVQLPIWRDSGALWTHVIESEDGSKIPLPYINRGTFYRSSQQHDLAVQDLAKAIQVKPDEPEAYLAMGKTYFDQG
ncbi:MAG: tetratricopeptide repeat protein, partial [Saprospiraceae bacterium]